MSQLRALALLLLLGFPLGSLAQTGAKPAKPSVPRVKAEQTPGYEPIVIEGFTVIVSKEALSHKDDAAYERKPLEVLEGELKTIVKFMPAKTVSLLRGILIWVEWDEKEMMSNGRPGNALATYYGGHQLSILAKGKHPLQARNITIHGLKRLTDEHQPKRDSGRCIILHEIAHAVHDQVLGNSVAVKSTYKQAMERKLLDPSSYASTNENEFFAEMTCAYFDQLHYYPRTKNDLKKHDAVTYKFMAQTWGKTKATTVAASKKETIEAPALMALDFGKPISGPIVTATTVENRPSLLLYWNGHNVTSKSSFTKIAAWDAELADYGLVTAAVHLTGTKEFAIKPFAEERSLSIAVAEGKWTQNSIVTEFKDFPLCLVYDHEGQCVFRGSPFEAENAARAAVGAALVADLSADDAPMALAPIVELLQKGKAPSTLFVRLGSLTRSPDPDAADSAKKLLAKLTESGRRILEKYEPKVHDEPLDAFLALERLPAAFKDTPLASKANELLGKLKQDKTVAVEMKARTVLTTVKKYETELSSRPGSFDPSQPKFRKDNALALRQLEQAVQQMKRSWPTTRATEQAVRIGERFGVAGQ